MSLPSFLIPYSSSLTATPRPYLNAVFHHKKLSTSTHSLWWPPKQMTPETIIFFIPGNPGLLDFYTTFLTTIYEKDSTLRLAVFGHSHLGHTPGVGHPVPALNYKLTAQLESILEALDATRNEFPKAKLVVIGHSVGSWLSLQILKTRPNIISAVFLLFPTISQIAKTPNGRRLSWFFSPYLLKPILWLSYLIKLLPAGALNYLFHDWPLAQVHILRTFLHSPSNIHATLGMAHDEMSRIRDLEVGLLEEHWDKLWYYFGDHDDWVGEEKYHIVRFLPPSPDIKRVVHGHAEIPHAFSINHSEDVANQCHLWLCRLNSNESK